MGIHHFGVIHCAGMELRKSMDGVCPSPLTLNSTQGLPMRDIKALSIMRQEERADLWKYYGSLCRKQCDVRNTDPFMYKRLEKRIQSLYHSHIRLMNAEDIASS